jgi:hypothetical protein
MTDIDPKDARTAYDSEYVDTPPTDVSGWVGWILFAAVIMFILGVFQISEGLVGILSSDYYTAPPNALAVHVSYSAWGWTQLLLGVVLIAAAGGIMVGNSAARVLGVVLAFASATGHMLFFGAHPAWSVIIVALDILVAFALVVHGDELRTT